MRRDNKNQKDRKKLALKKQTIREIKPAEAELGAGALHPINDPFLSEVTCC